MARPKAAARRFCISLALPLTNSGLPALGDESLPERLKYQHKLYKWLALPAALYAGMVMFAGKNFKEHSSSLGRGSEEDRIEATTMTRWERSVPVYGVPVLTRGFWALLAVIAIGMVLTALREVVGLGGLPCPECPTLTLGDFGKPLT